MSQALVILPLSQCASGCRMTSVRCGHFVRLIDRVRVQRYLCKVCKRKFSDASFDLNFGQKKRHLNSTIIKDKTGGKSQRRIALDLGINRKTVVRKFVFYGRLAIEALPILNRGLSKVKCMEFDDLETAIHTKCKPVSVPLAVEFKTRRILGFRVAEMPAKGKLARISRKKYGPRKDGRAKARNALFEELKPLLTDDAIIKSDQNPHYEADVKKHFPGHIFQTFKSRKACVVGQGELKRGGYDPIFSINHTFAMLRANINRLFRRTWCTSKRIDRLEMHIALYAINHNLRLIQKKT